MDSSIVSSKYPIFCREYIITPEATNIFYNVFRPKSMHAQFISVFIFGFRYLSEAYSDTDHACAFDFISIFITCVLTGCN